MSGSETGRDDGSSKARNLPSWMSSRENSSKSQGKKPNDKKDTKGSRYGESDHKNKLAASTSSVPDFSKLLDGVVFVLSGFVNPERSTLRSQAIEMGGTYQPDWNSDCTLLVCAFPNTPKYRQVQSDGGTIVSKEWILKCYTQKELVDIEQYLMHVGKPWRRSNTSHEVIPDEKGSRSPPKKLQKQVNKRSECKPAPSAASKSKAPSSAKETFSASEVKRWVTDDLNCTISWLESLEEKPEASEIKMIAVEGILTCLQDAIDSLEQNQDVQQVADQWSFIPRVVKELAKIESSKKGSAALSKELCRQAKSWKQIYEEELKKKSDDSPANRTKKANADQKGKSRKALATAKGHSGYESDETIEMTAEEIDLAYRNVASKVCT